MSAGSGSTGADRDLDKIRRQSYVDRNDAVASFFVRVFDRIVDAFDDTQFDFGCVDVSDHPIAQTSYGSADETYIRKAAFNTE